MPYITREDGEHFVIPSYRDVLNVKQKNQLKKEIYSLSLSYGEYITLQKKSLTQYEVAFSSDTGYLLGESIWHVFNRPQDMIYCEAVPNTAEAIFVIVKSGSVYLDGKFPIDSIPEELVVFLTQQNQFEIYTYGDVPITEIPQDGRFNFEKESVKSFKVLDKPVFATLPLLKVYQLQLVDVVLKSYGIGVFPVLPVIALFLMVGAFFAGWSYLSDMMQDKNQPQEVVVDPYESYFALLKTPAPDQQINRFIEFWHVISFIPGWHIESVSYANSGVTAKMISNGGRVEDLSAWAAQNGMTTNISSIGIFISKTLSVENRAKPKTIYKIQNVMGTFIDRLAAVYPGNNLKIDKPFSKDTYSILKFTINFQAIYSNELQLIGDQFKDLPLVLDNMDLTIGENGDISGSISMQAIGT